MNKIEQLYAEWQSLQPLKDEYQQRLNRKFMLEFNYNSNHLEGNTLTYGQTELLLLFGKVTEAANMKDLEDMKASNVGLNMMKEQALSEYPLTETFIRQLHKTLLREDYTVYRQLPGGQQTSYVVHAGIYKTRPNSVRTITGELFEYASPEETPALMTDLISWYREAEESGQYSLAELCALFHYRYIRIHPFEDGNGRIARLMMNFILLRHNYPMIVVKSADKENYLRALSQCDGFTGTAPSAGAHAELKDIQPFVAYIEKCMERALNTCIKAAKGLSIEEDDDFAKALKILERQKRQDVAAEQSKIKFNMDEVWNVLEFVFFPIANEFNKTIDQTANVFRFCQTQSFCQISKTKDWIGGLGLGTVCRGTTNSQIIDFVRNVKSMWYYCELMNPRHPRTVNFEIKKQFYITFFDDHYFVDGILNKDFPYGKYPSEEEKQEIISQFKEDILKELQDKL
ncbi:MAG: Fic family protein [Muribaculaceae bacterium]|nr:Fic family protein [Muribaculaceae bacterium]